MARERLVKIHRLREKLPVFYSRSALHSDPALRIRKDVELAAFLGIRPVTMSQWQNGKDGEDENKDRMSPQGLRAVSEHLCQLLDGRIAFEQALELWQHAETEDFAHALWQHASRSIEDALATRSAELELAIDVDLPSRRQMVKVPRTHAAEVPSVPLDSSYVITVAGTAGEQLILLAMTARGVQLLAPAPWHAGRFRRAKERVPDGGECFGFDDYSGEYRFVGIALDADADPPELSPYADESPRMFDADRARLATYLVTTSDRWRWGERRVRAERPPA